MYGFVLSLLGRILCATASVVFLTACAKGPDGGGAAVNRLVARMTLDGSVDDRYYYFVAFDDDGEANDGPLPLFRPGGNGWGAGSFTKFVRYHQGQYLYYSHTVNPNGSVTDLPIGTPLAYTLPQGGNEIRFTLDLDAAQFDPAATHLDINFITTDVLLTDSNLNFDKTYDGLGGRGNEYVTIPVTYDGTYEDTDPTGDVNACPPNLNCPALDIIRWYVEIQRD